MSTAKKEYFEIRSYNLTEEDEAFIGRTSRGMQKYRLGCKSVREVKGLYHLDGDTESCTQVIFFRVQDLEWLVEDRDVDICEYDLLNIAEQLTGWYSYESGAGRAFAGEAWAKYVGKGEKWVRVCQSGGLDI